MAHPYMHDGQHHPDSLQSRSVRLDAWREPTSGQRRHLKRTKARDDRRAGKAAARNWKD